MSKGECYFYSFITVCHFYSKRALLIDLLTTKHYLIVATVSFHQLMYTANEGDDRVGLMLVLSDPSPADIAIQVYSVEGSATG